MHQPRLTNVSSRRGPRTGAADPLLPFMSLIPKADSGRPRRERFTLMLRFTRRHIAINLRGARKVIDLISPAYPHRRAKPDPGFEPHLTGSADEARSRRTRHPRRRAAWHHHVVCSAQHAGWQRDLDVPAAPTSRRVAEVPEAHRRPHAQASEPSPDRGKLRHAQAPRRAEVAGSASALHHAFHPDQRIVVEHGRAVLPRHH